MIDARGEDRGPTRRALRRAHHRRFRDGGGFEDDADRQLDLEFPGNARNNLRGQEGVAAQMEEIIMNADAVALKNLAPDFNQQELGRVSGRLGSFVRR